jgi:YidC/Oxa1 family membrane protein insertase
MNPQQNESPFGNPRFIFSIIIVFILLWGWQYYVNKKYPPQLATNIQSPALAENSAATKDAGLSKNVSGGTSTSGQGTNNKTGDANLVQPNIDEHIEKTFSYEDENVKWEITSRGMAFQNFVLKKYLNKDKKVVVFAENSRTFISVLNSKEVLFDLNKVTETQYIGTAFVDGTNIKRTLTYNKESMSFDIQTEFDVTPKSFTTVITDIKHKVDTGNFFMPSFDVHNFLYKNNEKVISEHISGLRDGESLNISASLVSLASIGTQYFAQGLVDRSDILPNIQMLVQGQEVKLNVNYDLQDAKVTKLINKAFIGPKLVETLQKVDPLMPEVMDYGMFGFISKVLLSLMKFLYGIMGNWGLAIIALTIIMRLIMLPFNIVSFKSARAMQKIQPELQAVREKYKNDPMAVNRETMALMKAHNANPLSSCLPMLIQIPVFFALWKTIGSSIEIYQQPFFLWITDLSTHDKFFVLPVLMGITMYLQQKMTPTTMDPTQQKILNFMPILFSLFMLSLPSGLTLYNFVSSLFGVAQQYFLLKDNKA